MTQKLNLLAFAAAPADRIACGLLDSGYSDTLAMAQRIKYIIEEHHPDQHFYIRGGTLGALTADIFSRADKMRDLEARNKEITGRLADCNVEQRRQIDGLIKHNSNCLASVKQQLDNVSKQRDDLRAANNEQGKQLDAYAKEIQDLKRQIGGLQTSMGTMAINLAHYKQLSEDRKTWADVDQGKIRNRDGIIEEQQERLRTWRTFDDALLTGRLGVHSDSITSDDQRIRWIVNNVEAMAKTIAVNTVDQVQLADLKEQNHRQGRTIGNYQDTNSKLLNEQTAWRNWALTQFGLSGDNSEIRAGIDDYCQTLAMGHVALVDKAADLEQTAKDLAHLNATQKDEIDNLNALKVLDGNCIDKLRDSLAYHRNNLADLRDGLLDNHNLKTTDWTSVHEAMKVIRRCACRTQNNGQIPCAAGTVVINNARIASQEVDSMNLVSAKSVKLNPSAAATKVVIPPEYAAAIRDIVRSEIDGAIKAVVSGK